MPKSDRETGPRLVLIIIKALWKVTASGQHRSLFGCFIVWLLLLLEKLDNMCILIICFPVCDLINFEFKISSSNLVLLDQN